jgi:hypothetical protein
MIKAWYSRTTGLTHSVADTGGPTFGATDRLSREHQHGVADQAFGDLSMATVLGCDHGQAVLGK